MHATESCSVCAGLDSAQKVTLAAQIWVKFLSSHKFETQKVAQRDIMGQIPILAFSKPSAQVIDQQVGQLTFLKRI